MPWAFSASDAKTWHYPGSVCRVTSEWAKSWHFPCSVWRPTSALLTVRSLVLIQQRASIFYGASLKMHLYRKAVFHCPHCFGSTYHCSTVPNSPFPFSSYFIRHYNLYLECLEGNHFTGSKISFQSDPQWKCPSLKAKKSSNITSGKVFWPIGNGKNLTVKRETKGQLW